MVDSIEPGSDAWLDQVAEPILDSDVPIIDPHHHLWKWRSLTYLLDDLWADTGSGHNVVKTVFVECGAEYLKEGPEHLRPVGETVFVEECARASRESGSDGAAVIAGIVARADLRLRQLDEVLDAHEHAGKGLFRGIRHAGALDPHPECLRIPGTAPSGLYRDPDFRRGVERLGERGLTYDTWHYHHQNQDFRDLALAVPNTTMVLDHFGTPLGVGPYADQREAIFDRWKDDIAAVAECPNVVAKLGGLAMPDNGFGWDQRATPPTSDEFVEQQGRYYHHAIRCFGAERCMFESNFPVDRWSLSYPILWNGLKKIAADYSAGEGTLMFHDTAERIYRL